MKKRQLVAGLMAVAMLATTAGCNSKPSTGTNNTSSGAKVTVDNSNFNPTGLPIIKEKKTYNVYVQQTSPIVQAKDKECVKKTEEATNVHIEWNEIVSSGWKEQINLSFSTNKLPDAIIGNVDTSTYSRQLAILNGLIESYAPVTKKFLEDRPEYKISLADINGNIVALPGGDETEWNIIDSALSINQTWLDKAKMSVPTTPEEFEKVLQYFKDNDMNGDGDKNDEIPFTFQDAWGWGNTLENIFGFFGAPESDSHVYMDPSDNKTVKFAPSQDGYYEALKWLNSLYTKGLMDKNAFTLDSNAYKQINATKSVMGSYLTYGPPEAKDSNGEEWSIIPFLKVGNTKPMIYKNDQTKTCGFQITTACKEPEVLLRWYDYINSSDEMKHLWSNGPEDLNWKKISDTRIEFAQRTPDEWKALGYDSSGDSRQKNSFAGQSPSFYDFDLRAKTVDVDNFENHTEVARRKKLVVYDKSKEYLVNGLPIGAETTQNIQRKGLLVTDIDNYLKQFIANAVLHGIDDAQWKAHLDKLKALGMDEYVKICQEYTDKLLSK